MGVTLVRGVTGVPGPEVQQDGTTIVSGAGVLNFTGNVTVTGAGETATINVTGGAGSITEVQGGTGIDVASGTGPVVTVTLADTAVTPGTYGTSSAVGTFQVDQQGRVVSASSTAISASAIGAAPSNAQYVVLAASAGLSDERVLTAGALVDLVDSGAGLALTIDIDLTELSIDAAEGQTTDYLPVVTAAGGQVRTLISDVIANAGIVPTSRTLTAGNGLSGGGDLSANRTFDLDLNELTTDATGGAPTDYLPFVDVSGANASEKVLVSDFVTNAGIVPTARTITPNAPLSGGGDLSANRTISLDAGSASVLLGRGSAAGAGAYQAISLGTNLSMSGTTLNATGGSGGLDYGKSYATARSALTM